MSYCLFGRSNALELCADWALFIVHIGTRVEIKGFCFPESVAKMLESLDGEIPLTPEHNRMSAAEPGDTESTETGARTEQTALRAYMEPARGSERLNAAVLARNTASAPSLVPPLLTMADRERHSRTLELTKRRIESVVVRQIGGSPVMTIETTARAVK